MIVTTKDDKGELLLSVFFHEDISKNTTTYTLSDFVDQVLLLDYNSDLRTDILGSTKNGTIVLLNDGNGYLKT